MTEKRAITLDDLYKYKSVEDVRISPDGCWIAYVRVDLDKASNSYKRNIWLSEVGAVKTAPYQFTRGGKDSQPRWSPDSQSLAFLSGRGEKPQVYLLPLTAPGGEARQITSHPNGVNMFNWSPDGTKIAFLSNMNTDERQKEDSEPEAPPIDKLEGKYRSDRREEDEKKKIDPRIITRVPYRVGTAFVTDRFAQIYVTGIEEGAKARRLTSVDANYQEPQWSRDGKFIYSARPANTEADEPFRQSRLFRIEVENGAETSIHHLEDHTDMQPLPSPDGKWIAYMRFPEDKASMRFNRLTVISAEDGEPVDLNLKNDLAPTLYRWASDGKLLFGGENRGAVQLYSVVPESGEVEQLLGGDLRIDSFDVAPNGTIAFVASTPEHPQEVFVKPMEQSAAVRLTDFNQPLVDEIEMQPYHHLQYKAPDGQGVEGWYLLPHDYEEGKQYPLILYIHGGPHIMWGPGNPVEGFEWQNMAARGYVTFFCNPRGSGGYGEQFQMAVYGGGWGDLAYGDIMAGVDALIDKGIVDSERLYVTGGSYGGYMTTWIVSHTDRFKAAVTQRGVYNLLSFFGTSDIPTFILNEFGTLPVDKPDFLWEQSPLAHAHKIKTPLLILHSENDFRVPISEAEQLFGYLRRVGTPTEFIRFPREGHELTRSGEPEHRIDHLKRILDWFERYV
jgi:dipeptidyl aminopeptidase/acylaminoacyl peptidase